VLSHSCFFFCCCCSRLHFDICITALASPASASSIPRSRQEVPEEKETILLGCISFWPPSMRCQSIENVTRPHGPRLLARIRLCTVPGNCQHTPEELLIPGEAPALGCLDNGVVFHLPLPVGRSKLTENNSFFAKDRKATGSHVAQHRLKVGGLDRATIALLRSTTTPDPGHPPTHAFVSLWYSKGRNI
jgi:hypothetical protein